MVYLYFCIFLFPKSLNKLLILIPWKADLPFNSLILLLIHTAQIQVPVHPFSQEAATRSGWHWRGTVFPMHHSLIKSSGSCRLMSLGTDYAGLYIMSVCLLLGLSIPNPSLSAFSLVLDQNHWTSTAGVPHALRFMYWRACRCSWTWVIWRWWLFLRMSL